MAENDKVSLHFSRHELVCRCGCGLYIHRPQLIDLAEKVREILKIPMYVNSGTRCVSHNARVDGSPTSKHLQGLAMDFYCKTLTPTAIYNVILSRYIKGYLPELGGMGIYKTFVHIDAFHAEDGHLRLWRGPGA